MNIVSLLYFIYVCLYGANRYHSFLRHDATNRTTAGSLPYEVNGFFSWPNPSCRTIALGTTQLLNRIEYQESSWGVKDGRRITLKTILSSVSRMSRKCGSLDISQPYVPPLPVRVTALPFSLFLLFLHCIILFTVDKNGINTKVAITYN
jgi:hypothetical protein